MNNEFIKKCSRRKNSIVIKINDEEWFNNKKNISINGNQLSATEIDKPVYLSYHEMNGNFNILPKEDILSFCKSFNYDFDFTAVGDNVENIKLYIISYDEESKLNMEVVKANEIRKITFSSKVKLARLALKFEGECLINLKKTFIRILCRKKIVKMPFHRYRQLGYDKPEVLKDIKVACIFDAFTMQCFEPEVKLITFTPDDWRVKFEFDRPHILMVESAWKGNDGAWKGKLVNNKGYIIEELVEIIEWCKNNNIPTVFWNKEDPVHYHDFISTVRHFDYVFTTDVNCIDKYKNDLNLENVHVLQFAAQPKLHNPTELLNARKDKICFAGSFYRYKYEHRAKDTKRLIEASEPYGIDIFDRNYKLGIKSYKFPAECEKYIVGVLQGKEMVKANKGYKIALNINTVKDSNTMFARRVFEILASNTPVVSNYSLGVDKMFNGIVVATDDRVLLEKEIDKLMTDKVYYEKKRIKGLREVMLNNTYEERMYYICDILGMDIRRKDIKILVVAYNEDEEGKKKIKDMVNKQSFHKFELVFITGNYVYDASNNLVGDLDELNIKGYDYVTYMNSNDYYGENYILDLYIGTKYTDRDIIGKSSVYQFRNGEIILNNEDHEYVLSDKINFNSMCISINSISLLDNKEIIDIFNENLEKSKKIVSRLSKYSIDRFNYIKGYNEKYNNLSTNEDLTNIFC